MGANAEYGFSTLSEKEVQELPESQRAGVRAVQLTIDLFFRPPLAFRVLLAGRPRVRYGVIGSLAVAIVYFAGISIRLAANAMHVPEFLVLNIPPERYYASERFFIFPAALAGVILAAGAIRLVAGGWKGQGRFEDLFALLGFSLVEVAVVIGLPDLVQSILAALRLIGLARWTDVSSHVWLGTAWYLLLAVLAVKEAQRLAWKESVLLGLLGFAANGLVQFIFMR